MHGDGHTGRVRRPFLADGPADGLHAVGTAYSRLSFTQPSRPAVLTGQAEVDSEPDTGYRYVLMPVRFAS